MMCGLAAVTISAAIVTGKLTDPEAWMTDRGVSCSGWLLILVPLPCGMAFIQIGLKL